MGIFEADQVTDAKRVVRGEHYLYAGRLLASRTVGWQDKFFCLTVAGRSAAEDIASMKAAIPRAIPIAVDSDPVAIEIARLSQAHVFEGDLFAYPPGHRGHSMPLMLKKIRAKFGLLDLINLDLCGNISTEFRKHVLSYLNHGLKPHGVFLLTFSYGRDAAPAFVRMARGNPYAKSENVSIIPDSMIGRLQWLSFPETQILSVLLYRGLNMPMCSILYEKGMPEWRGVVLCGHNSPGKIDPTVIFGVNGSDIRPACLTDCESNPADLYATPATRIAAWRAVETRRRNEKEGLNNGRE